MTKSSPPQKKTESQALRWGEWFGFVLAPLLTVWLVDAFSKSWFAQNKWTPMFRGVLSGVRFQYVQNPGVMGGLFLGLPPSLIFITVTTFGAFLLFVYFLLQYFVPVRAVTLRLGMSVLMGGIAGNVSDRVVRGAVLDFISIHGSYFFNLADLSQWFGITLIFLGILRDGRTIWRDFENRSSLWIDGAFQLRFILRFQALGTGFILVLGTLAYTLISVIASTSPGVSNILGNHRLFLIFILSFGSASILCLLALLYTSLMVSHRIAGPLYAFRRYIATLKSGDRDAVLKLRSKDELRYLEKIAEELKDLLQKDSQT